MRNKKLYKKICKILANGKILCYIICCSQEQTNRGVAQLVARVVWDHEVAGSIPVTSTRIKQRKKLEKSSFFLCLKFYQIPIFSKSTAKVLQLKKFFYNKMLIGTQRIKILIL